MDRLGWFVFKQITAKEKLVVPEADPPLTENFQRRGGVELSSMEPRVPIFALLRLSASDGQAGGFLAQPFSQKGLGEMRSRLN